MDDQNEPECSGSIRCAGTCNLRFDFIWRLRPRHIILVLSILLALCMWGVSGAAEIAIRWIVPPAIAHLIQSSPDAGGPIGSPPPPALKPQPPKPRLAPLPRAPQKAIYGEPKSCIVDAGGSTDPLPRPHQPQPRQPRSTPAPHAPHKAISGKQRS